MNRAPRLKWFLFAALVMLAGCGFHLRGTADTRLPESLSRLRVVVQDSKLANEPLLVAVKNALQVNSKTVVTDDPEAPTLLLSGEHADTQVLSVSANGRVSGYMLKYEVSFRLVDAKQTELLSQQTIRLIRDYTFDPVNILAKEQEEQELKRAMQRDAVQQIL